MLLLASDVAKLSFYSTSGSLVKSAEIKSFTQQAFQLL